MEHRQRRPCHAGTLPAGTVAPGSVPAPAARHRNGEQTPPPTICTGTHPAQQIAPPVQTEGQSSSAQRAAALAFFFCAAFPPATCPACRISSPARAGRCAAVATMTTPAPRSRSRSHRPPPAPGRISTASAAPMTPQPISCTACPLPTASSQQRQTSQQPAPAACTYQQHQRTPQPCRLPAAADQHHPRPPNGPKPAHRGPLPEGSDSLPDRHIDFAV